jgi:hypothetical protein
MSNTLKYFLYLIMLGLMTACPSKKVNKVLSNDFPNIIFIIADDMAWDDSGTYGHPHIKTPNIDKLAQDGMRFDNAFLTTSSCSRVEQVSLQVYTPTIQMQNSCTGRYLLIELLLSKN